MDEAKKVENSIKALDNFFSDKIKLRRNPTVEEFDQLKLQRNSATIQRDEAKLLKDEYKRQRDELKRQIKSMFPKSKERDQDGAATAYVFNEIDYFRSEAERLAQVPQISTKRFSSEKLTIKERELFVDRLVPPFYRGPRRVETPPSDVAFATVSNDKFVPGVEGLLYSLLAVYPDLSSPFFIFHDGSISAFVQRRLRGIYSNLEFVAPDMDWFNDVPVASDNHRRIGKLGYMNIYGLTLGDYQRVILLDSDLLILDDISELWRGSEFIVCYDAGDRDYCAQSEYTKKFIFNSGVISIPGHVLGKETFEGIRQCIIDNATKELCLILDRFADQKIWNIFLSDKEVRYAPLNYNCNIKYLVKYLGGDLEGISIVHFAGPKPWNDKTYSFGDFVHKNVSTAIQYPKLWTSTYKKLAYTMRLNQYHAYADARRRNPVKSSSSINEISTCVLIGNGPSLAHTNLDLVNELERFCFNWFILHDSFDNIAPDHLVLASHQFFGGWHVQEPRFPPNYIDRLLSLHHRPVIWTSFYFKELFEESGLTDKFEVNYFLFEKPFKRFVDKVGRYEADIDSFLDDGRTGVLTAAVPISVSLGFKQIVLVGCDSNYNQPGASSKYFYDMAKHTSLETNEKSLTATWTEDGRGQYAYRLVSEALDRREISFLDATVGGGIQHVSKTNLEALVASDR